MTLYSYIVTHDTGFAPNPFFGVCTLACCKPKIRSKVQKRKEREEDCWIVGLTPKKDGNRIVYFTRVDEVIGFDEYWEKYKRKRPNKGSLKEKNGDNIYVPKADVAGRDGENWEKYTQIFPSVHSKPNDEDLERKKHDLKGENVLVSKKTFVYFGSEAKDLNGPLKELVTGRPNKCNFSEKVKKAFRRFVSKQHKRGNFGRVIGRPGGWRKTTMGRGKKVEHVAVYEAHSQPKGIRLFQWWCAESDFPGWHNDLAPNS
jgi:hypothetical protein